MTTSRKEKRQASMNLTTVLILTISAASATTVSAMPACPEPFQHEQPNGEVVTLKYKGGPGYHWVTDMNDYTVLLVEEDGSYVYADDDGNGGLKPTDRIVRSIYDDTPVSRNSDNTNNVNNNSPSVPAESNSIPFKKDLHPTQKKCGPGTFCYEEDDTSMTLLEIMTRQSETDNDDNQDDDENDNNNNNNNRQLLIRGSSTNVIPRNGRELKSVLSHVRRDLERKTGPTGGKLRNLVIMMRWSDHDNRRLPTREQIDILMNHEGSHPLAPTGSVRDAFLENSYAKLDLESIVLDWVPMSMSELEVANGESGLNLKFHDAIREALQYVDSNNLVDLEYFDADQNDAIDAITFFHSGYAAERGGIDEYGTWEGNRIWSHKWALHDAFISKTGVEVRNYHVSSALWGLEGGAIGRIGVIVHETGHFLGIPDLYDRDEFGGTGLGSWGMMSNSWGFDWSQHYPPHGSAWMKAQLGWVDVQTPTQGTNFISYTADQQPSHPQIYRIDEGFPDGEYLLIENRQPHGLDSLVPQGGLIIYHIDEAAPLYEEGYPGQPGWPQNGNHYAVAVAQADGMYHLEGGENGMNTGDGGDPFHGAGVNYLIPCFDEPCQHPNTDTYQNGIVNRTNVMITDISNSADVMSFHYDIYGSTDDPPPPPFVPPSPPPSSSSHASTRFPSYWDTNVIHGNIAVAMIGSLMVGKNLSLSLVMATTFAAAMCV